MIAPTVVTRLEALLDEAYCVRCDSTQGHTQGEGHFEKGWCSVCWKERKPLPRSVKAVIEAAILALKDN